MDRQRFCGFVDACQVVADRIEENHGESGDLIRDLLARGIFTPSPASRRKIRRYIRHYNKTLKPIR